MATERTTYTLQSGTMAGESSMANVPGSYMKILKGDVSRIPSPSGVTWVHLDGPRTAPGSLADAELIAQGACMATGAELERVESPAWMVLNVFIRATNEQALRVHELVRASLPLWSDVVVVSDAPRDDGNGPIVPSAFPGDRNGFRDPRPTAINPMPTMVDEIIARQVAAGGVDTEGTRAEAERWCAMLAGCVCEGMRATTNAAPMRCDECGAVAKLVPLIGCCYYCTHRIDGSVRVVERGPGIAVDKTPGPHEGATAWASATWEHL